MTKSIFPANAPNSHFVLALILSIAFTILIYSLPIIIYRYAIYKVPVAPPKARKITIVYGIGAFIVVVIIGSLTGDPSPGGAVFFWSFINYEILKGGKQKSQSVPVSKDLALKENVLSAMDTTASAIDEIPLSEQNLFCKACGASLLPDSIFCDKCGQKTN